MSENVADNKTMTRGQNLFQERMNRVEMAIQLGIPDREPVVASFSAFIQNDYGPSEADL